MLEEPLSPETREKVLVAAPLFVGWFLTGLFFPAADNPMYFSLFEWPFWLGAGISAVLAVAVYGPRLWARLRDFQ